MDDDETDEDWNEYSTAVLNAFASKVVAQNKHQEARLIRKYASASAEDLKLVAELHKMEEAARRAMYDMETMSLEALRPAIWLEESADLKLYDYGGIDTTDTSRAGLEQIFKVKCNHVQTTYADKSRNNGIRHATVTAQKVNKLIDEAQLVSEHSRVLHYYIDIGLNALQVEAEQLINMCLKTPHHEGINSLHRISKKVYERYEKNTEDFKDKVKGAMGLVKEVSLDFMRPPFLCTT